MRLRAARAVEPLIVQTQLGAEREETEDQPELRQARCPEAVGIGASGTADINRTPVVYVACSTRSTARRATEAVRCSGGKEQVYNITAPFERQDLNSVGPNKCPRACLQQSKCEAYEFEKGDKPGSRSATRTVLTRAAVTEMSRCPV